MNDVLLKDILTPSKTVSIDYPGLDEFSVEICYIAREEMQKMRQKCMTKKWKNHVMVEDIDLDLFLKNFVKQTIKGWKGLKFKYLEEFLLVDISAQDPEDFLNFSAENAEKLMKNSTQFDTWVMEVSDDLENFTNSK